MEYSHYLYALFMASVDGIAMPLMKARHSGMIKGIWMFPVAILLYSTQPLLFYNSLSHESMSVMNVLRDVMSDVIVTLIGYFVFGETFTRQQCIGFAFCLVGIVLLGIS